MAANKLNERLTEIRDRFASKLDAKFEETEATLPLLAKAEPSAVEAVAAAYRRFHEICGTGRTLGFEQLGKAAGEVETILFEPYRAARALTDAEVAALRQAFDALKGAARTELQAKKTSGSTS